MLAQASRHLCSAEGWRHLRLSPRESTSYMSASSFSVDDVARYFRVATWTVSTWIHQGRLRAITDKDGQYRIQATVLAEFLRRQGLALDPLFFLRGAHSQRVLVVSSDEGLRQEVAAVLCEEPTVLELLSAEDCEEARCQVIAARPDLVVLGQTVDPRRCLDLFKEFHRAGREREVKVLILGAGTQAPEAWHDLCLMVDAVAGWPLEPATLRAQVHELLLADCLPSSSAR
jgi:excisionase family DNA binding protein